MPMLLRARLARDVLDGTRMTLQSLNRWKAFGLHLAISAVIAAAMVVLVVALWYPPPYFVAMGGAMLLRLVIGVDVVVGPLITLFIFDPAKPSLKYDLSAIAVLQLAALAYGGYVMFEARPVYTVFVEDRLHTVPANSIDADSLARGSSEWRPLPLLGPRIVAARKPKDPQEVVKITIGALAGGPDIQHLPHLYVPYSTVQADVARVVRPMVMLAQRGKESADQVNEFIKAHDAGGRSLGFLPVQARNQDFTAIVDRKTGEIIGFLPITPQ